MSDKIPEIIEQVKERHEKWKNEHDPKAEKVLNDLNKIYFANAIMPIISAYEESQEELENTKIALNAECEAMCNACKTIGDLKAELSKAQEKIKELQGKCLHPVLHGYELHTECEVCGLVIEDKEQTND